MLEVKNLYRQYKPKKGTPVVALNRVSLKFPDHGLIFVLGKSGSGKSTLLNVMGGLDKADDGEILIKGKSSKNFKQGDFDSYRNTYLGFIFQEYNILDEFNVGQNIALAIQLQGRKATTEEINNILTEVDLTGYGNRKPNELSGGQKQRVAIARALVKNPEIIFADEPTGALDSKTGIAVFETLKKLSKDKLVVVVSHDREFAEMYGDRVIELADGNVISDIEKTKVSGDVKTEGITIVDTNVIKIKSNYTLTNEDMEIIKEYLNSSKDERLISLDGNVNESVRHVARIDELGNKEAFKKTDEAAIINNPGVFNSIRSKLSLKHCFRIGASSLKVKPFRLIITILLSLVAFGMFGLADTMASYEKVKATVESIKDANYSSLVLETSVNIDRGNYNYNQKVNSGFADIEHLKEKYGLDFEGVYAIDSSDSLISINNFLTWANSSYEYYVTSVAGMYPSTLEDVTAKGFNLLAGTYPDLEGEVAITKHIYDSFKELGYNDPYTNEKVTASDMSYDKMIGKSLTFYKNSTQKSYIITAIIDTHFDLSGYEDLKNADSSGAMNIGLYMLSNQYKAECYYGYNTLLFTNEATIKNAKDITINLYNQLMMSIAGYQLYYSRVSKFTNSSRILMVNNQETLNKHEAIINLNTLESIVYENESKFSHAEIEPLNINVGQMNVTISNLYELITHIGRMNNFYYPFAYEYYDNAIENNMNIENIYYMLYGAEYPENYTREDNISVFVGYISSIGGGHNNTYTDISFDEYYHQKVREYLTPYLADIINLIDKPLINLSTIDKMTSIEKVIFDDAEFKIVGVELTNKYQDYFYLDDESIDMVDFSAGEYNYLLCPMTNDQTLLKKVVEDSYNSENIFDQRVYSLKNGIMPAFESINDMIEQLASVFLWIGVGFAVFASLMLFNFISISISYKKREIGILRAVGARSNDVFNIFFSESFIISMISYFFAILITFIVSNVINISLRSEYNLAITILSPSLRQIALVFIVCIFVAFISTFLPVYKIAMKKPIDAIQDR